MREYIIPMGRVNMLALAMIIPIALILGIPYFLIYGGDSISFDNLKIAKLAFGTLLFLVIFVIGALFHELIHGICWAVFAKKGWKAISFGIKWEYLTPYCHCDEPLKKWQFSFGALMPCIIMGIIPALVSYFTGNFKLWFFGFFFTVAAGGDLIASWMLRKVKRTEMVLDHPSELGFYVVEERLESK